MNDFISKELRLSGEIIDDSFESAFLNEYQKLKYNYLQEFRGTIYDIDIKQHLEKKIDSMYSFIKQNINLIASNVRV